MAAVSNIGIDLGTSTVTVFVKGKGILIEEPSLVAFDKDADKVRAIGEEARQLIGHTSGNNIAIRPLANGKISDFMILERMLKYFIDKAIGRRGLLKPRIAICLPGGVTEIEKRAVVDAAYQAGARDVTLVREAIAAAIGAELDITKAFGNMVVNIGGALTEVAVISLCGIVVSNTVSVAGDQFTRTIVSYLRDTYGMFIGEQTAEAVKLQLGSTRNQNPDSEMEVRGRDIESGLPKAVVITTEDVLKAFQKPMYQILQAVRNVLERTPPDLAADLHERGMVLTGAASQIIGLEELLAEYTGLPVMTAEMPEHVVALGTAKFTSVMRDFTA